MQCRYSGAGTVYAAFWTAGSQKDAEICDRLRCNLFYENLSHIYSFEGTGMSTIYTYRWISFGPCTYNSYQELRMEIKNVLTSNCTMDIVY